MKVHPNKHKNMIGQMIRRTVKDPAWVETWKWTEGRVLRSELCTHHCTNPCLTDGRIFIVKCDDWSGMVIGDGLVDVRWCSSLVDVRYYHIQIIKRRFKQ